MKFVILTTTMLLILASEGWSQGVVLQAPGGAAQAVELPATTQESTTKDSSNAGEKKSDGSPTAEVKQTTLLEGLNSPFSICISSVDGRMFVAESGALRIVEIKEGKALPVYSKFSKSKFRGYEVGPLSLHVETGEMFVGHDDDKGLGNVSILKIPDSDSDNSPEAELKSTTTLAKTDEEATKLGQFSSLVVKHSVAYVVTNGDEENGWIAMSEMAEGKLKPLRPTIATAVKSSFANPSSVIVSRNGAYILVSQMGSTSEQKDSRLTFYSLQGKLKLNLEVDLHDIVALAYSPNRKHLFALDASLADPTKGGLYKLIGAGQVKCKVKKLADLSYPTSMAFDSSGNLFITQLGGPPGSEEAKNGKVTKFEGLDVMPELKTESTETKESKAE